jgi:hypothetical protein
MGRGYFHTGDVASIDAMSADRAQGPAASGILSIYLENIIMEKSGSSGRRVHSDQGREVRRAAALIVLHAEHFGKIGENDIRPASRLLRRARRISRSLSRKT